MINAITLKKITSKLFALVLFTAVAFFPLLCEAQWTAKNNGLDGGNVIASATSSSKLYVATATGVFQSSDEGTNWTSVNDGFPTKAKINALTAKGETVFVGTTKGIFSYAEGSGHWSVMNTGLTSTDVLSFAVSSTNIFAGTRNGVFSSTDNGATWTNVSSTLLQDKTIICFAVMGSNLFAGTNGSGVFLTTNQGSSWNAVNTGLPESAGSIFSLIASGTNLFAAVNNAHGVYVTSNNGSNWTATALTNTNVMCLGRSGSTIFAGTDNKGVYISTNNGVDWTTTGLQNLRANNLISTNTNVFVGTVRGLYRSPANAINWIAVNKGLTSVDVRSFIAKGSAIFVGSFTTSVLKSTDNGATWFPSNAGLENQSVRSLVLHGSNIFAGTDDGVFLSSNDGASWSPANTGIPGSFVNALLSMGQNILAATSSGIYLSTNNGSNWTAVSAGHVMTLAKMGTTIIAGLSDGTIIRSQNDGATWGPAFPLATGYVWSLAATETTALAGTPGGVFRWVSGNSWLPSFNGLSDKNATSLVINGTQAFAGTREGNIFRSLDNGTNWSPLQTTEIAGQVQTLTVINTTLFAGTSGGLWSTPLIDIVTNRQPEIDVTVLIFPNPVEKELIVDASKLPSTNAVKIVIHDLTGKEIAQHSGKGLIKVDMRNYTSGDYILRVHYGDKVLSRQIIKK